MRRRHPSCAVGKGKARECSQDMWRRLDTVLQGWNGRHMRRCLTARSALTTLHPRLRMPCATLIFCEIDALCGLLLRWAGFKVSAVVSASSIKLTQQDARPNQPTATRGWAGNLQLACELQAGKKPGALALRNSSAYAWARVASALADDHDHPSQARAAEES